mgnify:FL=1|tara:strand:+ start:143 stop:391 length:249 start_codon:yes stop_codon:yes gene_type:complete
MSSNEKRYRFQIQFDTYAETDKEAVEIVEDMMYNFKDSDNPMIIWMAENYYASLQHREIDFQQIQSEISDDEMKQEKQTLSF